MTTPLAPVFPALPADVLGLSLGALEVGTLMASVLYGAFFIQVYHYTVTYSKDPLWVKAYVASMWVMETLHTIWVWMYLYDLSVLGFGNPITLKTTPWPLGASLGISAVINTSVQAFFTYRVQTISHKRWLGFPANCSQLLRVGSGIAIAIITTQTKFADIFHAKYSFLVFINFVNAAVFDVYVTSLLVYFLGLHKSRSPFRSTATALHRIILLSIETGMITTMASLAIIATWAANPTGAIWAAELVIYAKLYSNSLMVSLNSRDGGSNVVQTQSSSGSQTLNRSAPPFQISRTYNVDISEGTDGTRTEGIGGSIPLDELNSKNGLPFDSLDKC